MNPPFLPFHLPGMGAEEIRAASEVLRSGWLTTGPKVRLFEKRFARYLGAAHAVALNSATAALHLALEAIGLKEGQEVLVPTMTFTATAEVVRYFKAIPVLVDCHPAAMTIDPGRAAAAITRRTRAIIPMHMAGHPCDMEPILALAKARGLRVIEDAAHAPPIRYKGRMAGTLGDIGCFSFHAVKPITTGGEGGMAVTSDPDIARRIRLMSLHGIGKDAWKRYAAGGSWRYEVVEAGYKYNMTDVAAAIGLVQLRKADAARRARARIARRYDEAFQEDPALEVPIVAPYARPSWHLYILRLRLDKLRIGRDEFIERLRALGIGANVHYIPLHMHPYYRRTLGCSEKDFPVASGLSRRIVSLPIYPAMADRDVRKVISAVSTALRRARR